MKGFRKIALAAVMTGLSAGAAFAQTISMQGHGVVTTEPDIAMVSLGVVQQARTAGAALTAVSDQMRIVMDNLAAAGITGADVQTSGLRLNPRYDSSSSGLVTANSYEAGLEVAIRVRDLDNLGQVLDAAVKDGVNQFNGVHFSVADRAPLLAKARIAAVNDARQRAQTYADAAGVSLGKIQTIIEEGAQNQPIVMMDVRAEMAVTDVPIAQGEVGITADVTIVWHLSE